MKIGVLTDSYYPQLNGVVISIDNFTRELRRLGHEVYIFAPLLKNYKFSGMLYVIEIPDGGS